MINALPVYVTYGTVDARGTKRLSLIVFAMLSLPSLV